ncbi:MAG: glycosyltransferase family 39 protein [Ktedonobacteraceae bacterium]|nr:glycosyltransferase family 39 protein [Ktedonobacteraceae bacterium]
MVQTTTKKPEHGQNQQAAIASDTSLQSLLRSWEFYALIALAAFLRLYRLDTVVFGVDEGNMFHLARDFFTHGFFPITGNRSSIGNLYFPILIYFLMIPAALSANPQWADALIGLLNTFGVVITYIFTRRYYGRMAATIASLLFATSSMALIFSNSIWQPNMLPPLNMLFLFCVFRGVVERRKGWLFPALVLFGLLYELHSTAIYMLEVLVPACFFAWRTLRIRDGIFAALVLLVSAVPFIAWEFKSGFADIQIILHAAQTPAHIDWSAYQPYRALLGPYVGSAVERGDMLPSTPTSAFYTTPVRYLLGPLQGLHAILPWLFLCAVLTATGMVLWSRHLSARTESESVAQRSPRGIAGWLRRWLADFRTSPLRQGTLLLLIWQIGGLASLIHHSVPLYPHYYTFFLPGQFILLGIFFAQISALLQRYPLRWRAAPRAVVSTAATLLIVAQTLCSGVYLTDMINGNFNAQAVALNFYNMASLQPALDKANQLAQVYHAQRLYIATSFSDESALYALSEQIKTPVTLFDGTHCTLLPGVEAGPVVFLETPYLTGTDQLLHRYATIQQMETVWRPGGDPSALSSLG